MHTGLVVAALGLIVALIDIFGVAHRVDAFLSRTSLGMRTAQQSMHVSVLRNSEGVFYGLFLSSILLFIAVVIPIVATPVGSQPRPDEALIYAATIPSMLCALVLILVDVSAYILGAVRTLLNILAWPARGAISLLGLLIALTGFLIELHLF